MTDTPSLEAKPGRFAGGFDEPQAVAVWVAGALVWLIVIRRVFRGLNINS